MTVTGDIWDEIAILREELRVLRLRRQAIHAKMNEASAQVKAVMDGDDFARPKGEAEEEIR